MGPNEGFKNTLSFSVTCEQKDTQYGQSQEEESGQDVAQRLQEVTPLLRHDDIDDVWQHFYHVGVYRKKESRICFQNFASELDLLLVTTRGLHITTKLLRGQW